MSDIIGIILILVFLVMAFFFANIIAGRKKGDQQIIDKLAKENDSLYKEIAELQKTLEKITTDRGQKRLNMLKLGSKKKFATVDPVHDEQLDN